MKTRIKCYISLLILLLTRFRPSTHLSDSDIFMFLSVTDENVQCQQVVNHLLHKETEPTHEVFRVPPYLHLPWKQAVLVQRGTLKLLQSWENVVSNYLWNSSPSPSVSPQPAICMDSFCLSAKALSLTIGRKYRQAACWLLENHRAHLRNWKL